MNGNNLDESSYTQETQDSFLDKIKNLFKPAPKRLGTGSKLHETNMSLDDFYSGGKFKRAMINFMEGFNSTINKAISAFSSKPKEETKNPYLASYEPDNQKVSQEQLENNEPTTKIQILVPPTIKATAKEQPATIINNSVKKSSTLTAEDINIESPEDLTKDSSIKDETIPTEKDSDKKPAINPLKPEEISVSEGTQHENNEREEI